MKSVMLSGNSSSALARKLWRKFSFFRNTKYLTDSNAKMAPRKKAAAKHLFS